MNKITEISSQSSNDPKNLVNYKGLLENKIVAMVPVRAGSTRVPNKNVRKFADTNLLELKLKTLKKIKEISQIVVSTDCKIAADIAHNENVKIQWRNKYFAGSNITNDEHWLHIAETSPGKLIFLAQVTSPFLRLSTMQNAINTFLYSNKYDSLNSVSIEKKFLWKDMEPINYDVNVTPKSQDLPDIFSLNFAITIIQKMTMIKRKNVVGFKPSFLFLDKIESLDIDDLIDFKIAELIYKERGIKWLMS